MRRDWLKTWVYWLVLFVLISENILTWAVTLPFWQAVFTNPGQSGASLAAMPLSQSAFRVLKAASGLTCAAALIAALALQPSVRRLYRVHMVLAITASVLLAGNRYFDAASDPRLTLIGLAGILLIVGLVYAGLSRLVRHHLDQHLPGRAVFGPESVATGKGTAR